MNPIRRTLALLALTSGLLAATQASALETPWTQAGNADVRLVSGAIVDGALEAGIEIRLAPGWKTYWRYPGDSGVPPRFDWSGSRNLDSATVAFPAPRRFSDGASGFSIGYKGSVILPVRLTLQAPDKPTRIALSLDFAVCEALCVPAHAQVALDVPAGGATGSGATISAAASTALATARATVPAPAPVGGSQAPAVLSATVDTRATPPVVTVAVRAQATKFDLFAEGPEESWALPLPQVQDTRDGITRFTFALDGLPAQADWHGAELRLTLVDGTRAIETRLPLPAK